MHGASPAANRVIVSGQLGVSGKVRSFQGMSGHSAARHDTMRIGRSVETRA